MVEQLICNQQVRGSSPFTSSSKKFRRSQGLRADIKRVCGLFCSSNMEEFPSGQRGQTVNLLRLASVVRIHPPPPENTEYLLILGIFFFDWKWIRKPVKKTLRGSVFRAWIYREGLSSEAAKGVVQSFVLILHHPPPPRKKSLLSMTKVTFFNDIRSLRSRMI